MTSAAVPAATYRLQFNAAFTFDDATAIVDYLDALGVSHGYTSSYLKAVPGSPHGYDVTDPSRLNPEIGDEPAYWRWIEALRHRGMGHILDLVPNHMGIARSANPWWQDVLENGPSSRYAAIFDIDWRPLKPELANKVLLPILGSSYGEALERQEMRLEYEEGAFRVRYGDYVLPIAPGTYDHILGTGMDSLLEALGTDSDEAMECLSIMTAIRYLPGSHTEEPDLRAERHREKEVIKRRVAALAGRSPRVREHIARAVEVFNGRPGRPESFDRLDRLLTAQAYRPAHWRVAAEEINYRRFFDINELAAIRMEDNDVFELVHGYVFELIGRGAIDGLRIDHVDGLYDPGDYLQRLQARARAIRPDLYSEDRLLHVIAEKILGVGEELPRWPVAGTTGYDFLANVNGLFIDERNETALNSVYEHFTRVRSRFRDLAYQGKELVLRVSMASELNVLAHALNRFSERSRYCRDFTLNSLTHVLREIIACFPVYRTYVNPRDPVSDHDREYIERATSEAKRRNRSHPALVFDFVRDLLLKRADYIGEAEREEHLRFVGKFQQVTSPVTAKGIEDTALYIYNRLTSLNEVGAQPDRFGISPDALHAWLADRLAQWPDGLSATSTHDAKRSEDVRARLNVLSELPGAWKQALSGWARINGRGRSVLDGQAYPSRNEEYFLYQALVGSWPLAAMTPPEERQYCERIVAYMHKAMREAKMFTSWLNPSRPHEAAMARFVEFVLAPENTAFRTEFVPFQQRIARYGLYNSLAQLALKIAAPGVPDFYQGSELWDFSLVDPDNRRPVDYERRQRLLHELRDTEERDGAASVAERLAAHLCDDRTKLFATSGLLQFRRSHVTLFQCGGYYPLAVEGSRHEHLFAFGRTNEREHMVVVVPRLIATLLPDVGVQPLGERVWDDTRIELPADWPATYRHVLTQQCVHARSDEWENVWSADPARGRRHVRKALRAADVFQHFPVALLEGR